MGARWSSASVPQTLGVLQELRRSHRQSLGDAAERIDRDVPGGALHHRDVGPVEVRPLSQFFLRQTASLSSSGTSIEIRTPFSNCSSRLTSGSNINAV